MRALPPPPAGGGGGAESPGWAARMRRVKQDARPLFDDGDWSTGRSPGLRAAVASLSAAVRGAEREIVVEECGALPVDAFRRRFLAPMRPCVVAGIPREQRWRAARWEPRTLLAALPPRCALTLQGRGEHAPRLAAADYLQYLEAQQGGAGAGGGGDDEPLYVFDELFDQRSHALFDDWCCPPYFPDRGGMTWLAIGPACSGTRVHVDPVGTSAWNTVLYGTKLWALFPPATPAAVARCGRQVGEAYSIADYFVDVAAAAAAARPVLFEQLAGETVFVPAGWWHAVVNVGETVAVTQNFSAP